MLCSKRRWQRVTRNWIARSQWRGSTMVIVVKVAMWGMLPKGMAGDATPAIITDQNINI
jgi:hypothetical protein